VPSTGIPFFPSVCNRLLFVGRNYGFGFDLGDRVLAVEMARSKLHPGERIFLDGNPAGVLPRISEVSATSLK